MMMVDFMTFRGEPTSITYVGVSKQNLCPFTSASFSHPMQCLTQPDIPQVNGFCYDMSGNIYR